MENEENELRVTDRRRVYVDDERSGKEEGVAVWVQLPILFAAPGTPPRLIH